MSNTVTSSVPTEPWVETTLGERAEYITSGSRDWSRYYAESGAIFIRTQDINRNRLSLEQAAFVKLPEKVEGKRSLVRKGDLLITITGANVGKVAVVEAEIPEAYVSQSVCLVRLKDPSLAKFVHLQLTAKRGDKTTVESMAYGLGRPVLNLENIRSAPIRVAPANVRVVIVAEIEKQFSRIDEAVTNLKRVKANLKRYKAAVLKAAVEGNLTEDWRKLHPNFEPASRLLERILTERRAKWTGKGRYEQPSEPDTRNLPSLPERWAWVTLHQLGWVKGGKRLPAGHDYSSIPTHHPYVRVTDFEKFSVRKSELKFLKLETYRVISRYTIDSSDVYISIAGTIGLVGTVPQDLNGANLTENAAKITGLYDTEPKYLCFALASPDGQARIAASTIATTQSKLSLFRIEAIPLPLPPYPEQQMIVAEVERRLSVIDELEATVQANLSRADRLRQSVLSRAFAGKLVPQIPTDEPTSVLLNRLAEANALKDTLPPKGTRKSGGITMPKAKPSRNAEMGQRETKSLYDLLIESQKRLTPDQLFTKAGFGPELIDEFYEELKRETRAGRIVQERPDNAAVYLKAV